MPNCRNLTNFFQNETGNLCEQTVPDNNSKVLSSTLTE